MEETRFSPEGPLGLSSDEKTGSRRTRPSFGPDYHKYLDQNFTMEGLEPIVESVRTRENVDFLRKVVKEYDDQTRVEKEEEPDDCVVELNKRIERVRRYVDKRDRERKEEETSKARDGSPFIGGALMAQQSLLEVLRKPRDTEGGSALLRACLILVIVVLALLLIVYIGVTLYKKWKSMKAAIEELREVARRSATI